MEELEILDQVKIKIFIEHEQIDGYWGKKIRLENIEDVI
jgi:hypothetical protein